MSQLKKYPPLTAEQQALVVKWMGLPIPLVRKVFGRVDEDALAEGYLGLCYAAAKFETTHDASFATYATYWIRALLLRYLMFSRNVAFKNRAERHIFFNLRKVEQRMIASGAEISEESLAAELEVPVASLERFRASHRPPVSLELVQIADESGDVDVVAEHDAEAFARAEVSRCMKALDARERKIIRRRWLGSSQPTLAELGQDLNISRERVRQIEERAIGKLRRMVLGRVA